MMLATLLLAAMLSMQAATPAPARAPSPARAPRNWPAPVMDQAPPALPELAPGAVLILSKTNGFRDPEQIDAARRVITQIVEDRDVAVFETENAAIVNRRDLAHFSTIVFNSTSGNIFTPEQRTAFQTWVENGGGVVLLHGAGGDPEYDWSWWPEVLIGAQFIGHSGRPKQFQVATVQVRDPAHPATGALPAEWSRTDEWYSFDRVPSGNDTRILATLDEGSYDPYPERVRMGAPHPIIWTRCVGRGRVFYSALGHKAETYSEPLHQRMIDGAIRWSSRQEGEGCGVTPDR
jgi:type 1 glutamine amidotransferase